MLLKAIHNLSGVAQPGEIFVLKCEKEIKRLTDLGAAIPARKIISLDAIKPDTTTEIK